MHYALYAPCKRQWLCKRIQLTHWCSTTVMHYCDAALLAAPSCITLCTGLNFHRIRLLWIEADKMIQMSHTEHILLQCFPCAVYSELLPARILLHWSTFHCITVCSLGMYLTAAFFIVVGIPLQCIWLMRPLSQMPWKPVGCISEMQFSRHPHGISPTWPSFKSKTAILPVRPTFRGSF